MAEVRVMLKFDYAPPAEPASRLMWMLVSLEHLRTINDLSALILARYYPQHRGLLSLYVHGCLLPPSESARLVRDNDVIRVLWTGYDPEDDDIDNDCQARPSRKRSWQRCEEDAEDASTIKAKKRRCTPQGEETPRSRKETADVEDTEQAKSSRRKSKKGRKVAPQERAEEAFTESKTPSGKSTRRDREASPHQKSSTKGKKPPKELYSKTVQKTKPNQDLPAKNADSPSDLSSSDQKSSTTQKRPSKLANKSGANVPVTKTNPNQGSSAPKVGSSSDSSSSEQELSNIQKRPSKVAKKAGPNKTGANVPVTKTNPSQGSSAPKVGSSSDSSSSDQESSTIQKRPSMVVKKVGANKAGANVSVTKTDPNQGSSAPKVRSSSDSSSSDQELSNIQKKPSKVAKKAGANVSVTKTKPNVDSSVPKMGSSSDSSSSSSDQELATARKKSSEATRNSSNLVSGKERRKDVSASDYGEPIKRSGDGVTAPLVNGTSERPSQEIPSRGCDVDAMQEPVTAQCTPIVTNGHEAGGIQQQCEAEPGLYNHGRGRGRGAPPWMGPGGHGFRGQARGMLPWRDQGGQRFRGPGDRRRGRGYNNQFFHSYDSPTLKQQQLEEPIANLSVVIQNPVEIPKEDYDALPLLAAPPQAGKVIAFKILELNEDYSPELSDYKEGVVRSYDPVTQQIEVELLAQQKKREPGKFDLVYESEDGMEIVEYAVLPDRKMVQAWTSLISPRLVMGKGSEEGISLRPL